MLCIKHKRKIATEIDQEFQHRAVNLYHTLYKYDRESDEDDDSSGR